MTDAGDEWVTLGEALELYVLQLTAMRRGDPGRDPHAALGWAGPPAGDDVGGLVAELRAVAEASTADV